MKCGKRINLVLGLRRVCGQSGVALSLGRRLFQTTKDVEIRFSRNIGERIVLRIGVGKWMEVAIVVQLFR